MRILFFLLSCPVFAQNFAYQAPVGPVAKSGYYRIELPPDVVGRLQAGLGDIRLYGAGRADVPYLLTRQTGREANVFVAFELLEKTNVPNKQTTVVVRRPAGQPIQSLSVEFKNTNVSKAATLSGSNDRKTWYALDDAIWIGRNEANQRTATTAVQTIPYPPVDYTYLRLTVADSSSAPLNIVRIGSYGQTTASARYTPISGLRVTQRDSSDQHTYLRIDRPAPARLDRLTIQVRSTMPFRRSIDIGQLVTERVGRKRGRRGPVRPVFYPLVQGVISSSGDSTWSLPGLSTENMYLRIASADNPPLPIGAVSGAQVTTYLTAHLLADNTYLIRFGSMDLPAPVYDLAFAKNLSSGTLPTLGVGAVTGRADAPKPAEPTNRRYLLWGVMAAVLALLGVMTYSLLNGVSRRQQAQ